MSSSTSSLPPLPTPNRVGRPKNSTVANGAKHPVRKVPRNTAPAEVQTTLGQDQTSQSSPILVVSQASAPSSPPVSAGTLQIPGGTFPTNDFVEKEDAVKACKAAALEVGFHLVTGRSNEKVAILKCERNGTHQSTSTGRREVTSRKCGCEFMLAVRRSGAKTARIWRVFVDKNIHNHDTSTTGVRGHGVPRKPSLLQELAKKRRLEEKERTRKTRLLEKAIYKRPPLRYDYHVSIIFRWFEMLLLRTEALSINTRH